MRARKKCDDEGPYKAIYYKHLGSTGTGGLAEAEGNTQWGRGKCRKFTCANCEQFVGK